MLHTIQDFMRENLIEAKVRALATLHKESEAARNMKGKARRWFRALFCVV